MNWYKRDWLPHALTLVALVLWWDIAWYFHVEILNKELFKHAHPWIKTLSSNDAFIILSSLLLFSISIVFIYRSNIWGYLLSAVSIFAISSSEYIGILPSYMHFDNVIGIIDYLEFPIFSILLLYLISRLFAHYKYIHTNKISLLNKINRLGLFTRSLFQSLGRQILLFVWLLWWLFSPIASYIDFKYMQSHYTNYWDSFLQYNLETPFRYPDIGQVFILFVIIIIASAITYYIRSTGSIAARVSKTSTLIAVNIIFFVFSYYYLFS